MVKINYPCNSLSLFGFVYTLFDCGNAQCSYTYYIYNLKKKTHFLGQWSSIRHQIVSHYMEKKTNSRYKCEKIINRNEIITVWTKYGFSQDKMLR